MANVIINPQSGILEFNTGTAGSSVFDNSFSGAARLTFNTGEVNLKSYATGVLDRFTVDGSQGRLFSVSDSLTGSIFSVNDIAGLPIIEVNSTTTDVVNIGTYGTNALVVSGSGIGMGVAAPTAKLDIRDTWNNAATTFTAVKADVTDTSSNAASLLMDLRVGGTSRFKVSKSGDAAAAQGMYCSFIARATAGYLDTRIDIGDFQNPCVVRYIGEATSFVSFGQGGIGNGIAGFSVKSDGGFAWTSTTSATATRDLVLLRDGSGTLAQRNGANAQIFRLYNTYTDASNYERGFFRWNTNLLEIGAEAAGTGTSRNLSLLTAGSARLSIDSAGNITLGDGVRTDLTLLDLIARGDGDGIRLYSKNNTAGGSVNAPSISFYRSTTGPSASARFKIAGHNGSDFSGFSLSSPDISADWIRASNNLNDLGIGGTGLAIASYQRHYFFNSVVVGKDLGASSIPESGTIRSGQKLNNATNIAGSNLTLQAGAGTGNSTTNGSIILQTPDSTVSGTDIQLYSTKFILSRFGNVGIGTVSPQLKLHVSADSGSTYSWGEGIQVSAFNNNANFRPFVGFYRARGTEASPLDIAANDVIGSFSFISRVSGIPIYSSTVRSVAKDSAGNGRIEFYITTSGTEQLSIGIDGLNLAFGGYTSSFPAIKRSSAILQARLADDSGYTTIDAQHRLQGTVPTSATDTGTAGDIRYDANYIYICTATNTWKRVAISTWP